ncbi:MAG TPA: MmoB/DmpM family protein [Azoarcus taiwanensis]|uniref:Monooxygenase n=1 Tax=Azoarcus taiwanensis TaxID=666964 RepID=A0A972J9D4_9RHOO|nr:MmoB/DmpM family protein [Azoarcus taiwanensis]NMG01883.1 monooxygenase [Azoarcus taiwanensis]HRQ59132.1 MmoB/DmpM family protein [Azoarcus taiwanensis]
MPNIMLVLQANEETRPIVEAVAEDNPHARVDHQPAMVKIDAEDRLAIRRESIEEKLGRPFDLQELHINLITLSGHIDETDDEFVLSWNN